jgi:DSF synthase
MSVSNDTSSSVRRFPISDTYAVELDASLQLLWSNWEAPGAPYFSPELLSAMEYGIATIADRSFEGAELFRYFVLRSMHPRVFNLGGDLALFRRAIIERDAELLTAYAQRAIQLMWTLYSGFGRGVTTVALVQGKCLGGGFEAAMACDHVFAERDAEFCFSEIQLGIYPGMGALVMLSRRLDKRDYEAVCATGRSYTADALHELGLVDEVVERGQGQQAVEAFVRRRRAALGAHEAIRDVQKSSMAIDRSALEEGVARWVDLTMGLEKRRLALLELAMHQQRTM